MTLSIRPIPAALLLCSVIVCATHAGGASDPRSRISASDAQVRAVKVGLVKNRSEGPAVMEREGLRQRLAELGCEVQPTLTVALTPEEDKQYGAWNKTALENRALARLVRRHRAH